MAGVYESLAPADMLVIASPVYFYSLSAQLKAVIDRLHNPLRDTFSVRQMALLLVGASSKPDLFDSLLLQYRKCLDFFGLADAGCVLASGVKAKGDDILAGVILKEYGLRNIVDDAPSLLEDLSMEEIIRRDPHWIFVVTMGDEAAAAAYMRQNLESDPAWNGLSAVREGRCVLLPQDLFHYKPNERWDESYEYLAKILYPDLF